MREYGNETLTEISYLILLSLCTPNHGYGIMHFLDKNTEGRIKPGAGTLYGVLNSLESKGWISLIQKKDRKKIYLITTVGKKALKKEIERIQKNYLLGEVIIKQTGEFEHENF